MPLLYILLFMIIWRILFRVVWQQLGYDKAADEEKRIQEEAREATQAFADKLATYREELDAWDEEFRRVTGRPLHKPDYSQLFHPGLHAMFEAQYVQQLSAQQAQQSQDSYGLQQDPYAAQRNNALLGQYQGPVNPDALQNLASLLRGKLQ